MEKQKGNPFRSFRQKFHLLNSQEHTEEINLISSCSSDYEDSSLLVKSVNRVSTTRTLKRKRKKKVPKNSKNIISNLSVTILDTSRECNKQVFEEKSPVLTCKVRRKSPAVSPVLHPSRTLPKVSTASSPIITTRNNHIKSPVLVLRTESPKSTAKVRKRLFEYQNGIEKKSVYSLQSSICDMSIKKDENELDDIEIVASPVLHFNYINVTEDVCRNSSKAKSELVQRVKSFFDSHFSENSSLTSQNSISDISSPKNSTKTSEEIEILTCKSQVLSNNNSIKSLKEESRQSSESSIYNFSKNTKNIRYKKDGLAYRLNNLLKKQNASLSLWQHERFMAANSNFVIPKGEFTVFRIQKVHFKYGCHLIESVDANDEKFLILINSCYVLDNLIGETVLKLYEPYNILDCSSDCKLVINVTKFEYSNF